MTRRLVQVALVALCLAASVVTSSAQVFTGREGRQVPVADTVRGFKDILDGKYDNVPEGEFYMKGGIEDVRKG